MPLTFSRHPTTGRLLLSMTSRNRGEAPGRAAESLAVLPTDSGEEPFFCYTSGEKSTCKKGTRTIANGHAFQNGPRPLCFSPLFFSFAAWQPWLSRFSWAILPLEAQCRQWPGASRGGNFQQGRGLTMPLPATTND